MERGNDQVEPPTTPKILYRIPCVLHGEKNPFAVEIDETLTVGIGKAHQGMSFEFFVINLRCRHDYQDVNYKPQALEARRLS